MRVGRMCSCGHELHKGEWQRQLTRYPSAETRWHVSAAERVYFVVIQREAMNLPCFVEFFEDYEIPDEVKTRLGPNPTRSGFGGRDVSNM